MVPLQVIFHQHLEGLSVVDCIVMEEWESESGRRYRAGEPFTMALRHDGPSASKVLAKLATWADHTSVIEAATTEVEGARFLVLVSTTDELVLELEPGG